MTHARRCEQNEAIHVAMATACGFAMTGKVSCFQVTSVHAQVKAPCLVRPSKPCSCLKKTLSAASYDEVLFNYFKRGHRCVIFQNWFRCSG